MQLLAIGVNIVRNSIWLLQSRGLLPLIVNFAKLAYDAKNNNSYAYIHSTNGISSLQDGNACIYT